MWGLIEQVHKLLNSAIVEKRGLGELKETPVDSGRRTAAWLIVVGRVLSVFVLLGGLATLAGSVYIATGAYTPVWMRDEWAVPMDYQAFGSH